MKTKEEVIQEAYDNTFPDSSNYSFEKIRSAVDENGWYRFIEGLTVNICTTGFDYDKGAYRPQSLRGIETNNGWIKIESVDDIPTELTECYVFDDDGDICYYTFGIDNSKDYAEVVNGAITHYQPIINPLPPLY